ncbi:unnamed protein product [Ambrosiozyma monospora]|uniref:Unnamed protein product n=1 Tax=Ambrosiozyma monospora TaxID=43982 RepID=A0ACB5T4P5_AMBMO|nr:unnamed protein product [Ambrosiozyma monospora]
MTELERSRSSQSINSVSSDEYHGNENQQYPQPTELKSGDEANSPNDERNPVVQTLTKVSTIRFDKTRIVPRNKRRGILGNLTLIPEYDNPRDLPPNIKYVLVFVVAFCAMLGPMGTSILLPAIDTIVEDLKTTVDIVNISIGCYLLTLGVIPIWWSSFSERHGRRSIYIISFSLYVAFTIGCALSTNIGMLIGFRILSGGCAASVQSMGAGTISDLYQPIERGAAMGLFYLGTLSGPLLAPIIGGAINQNKSLGWRATQWFLVILGGCSLLIIVFCLPETLRKQDSKEAIRQILRDRLRKPDDVESQRSNQSGSDKLGEAHKDIRDKCLSNDETKRKKTDTSIQLFP